MVCLVSSPCVLVSISCLMPVFLLEDEKLEESMRKIGGDDGECNKKVPSNLFLRNSCHMEW